MSLYSFIVLRKDRAAPLAFTGDDAVSESDTAFKEKEVLTI
ncbi:hypothetical protein [Tomitella gaofuii]|nr:hypothetical protein [Tomitella gaofuii]